MKDLVSEFFDLLEDGFYDTKYDRYVDYDGGTDTDVDYFIDDFFISRDIKYRVAIENFDGGPGYSSTHYAVAFINEGELELIDFLTESF